MCHVLTISKSGEIHDTTTIAGKVAKNKKHITIAVKNPSQVVDHTQHSVHGYTESLNPPSENESIAKETKPDNTKDRRGKEIWPHNLEEKADVEESNQGE